MLALYRSGRQAEALDAYQQLRHVLVEELGIEPTAAVKELERAILAQDAALDLALPPRPDGRRKRSTPTRRRRSRRRARAGDARAEARVGAVLRLGRRSQARRRGSRGRPGARRALPPDGARGDRALRGHGRAADRRRRDGRVRRSGGARGRRGAGRPRGAPRAEGDRRAERAGSGPAVGARGGEHRSGRRVARRTGRAPGGAGQRARSSARPSGSSRPRRSGGVAVGERTFEATRRLFEYEPLPAVAATGGAEPVAVWHALAAKGRLGSDVLRAPATPMVGRELDLALLKGMFDKAAGERTAQLVTVVGEPGVGKSRLVAELFRALDDRPELDHVASGPLPPVRRGHHVLGARRDPEGARGDLRVGLPGGRDREARGGAPRRRTTARGCGRACCRCSGSSRARRRRTRRSPPGAASSSRSRRRGRRCSCSRTCTGPTTRCSTSSSISPTGRRAFRCSSSAPRGPELYERHPAWGAGLANQTAIRLSPLSEAETAQLVSALLDEDALPPHTQRLLLERAGGNPLYAEEFVRMLRDRGLLDGAASSRRRRRCRSRTRSRR